MGKSPAAAALGPFLVGVTLSLVLYGILVTQTQNYFSKYKGDRLWMKIMIGFLFFADTANCAFTVDFLYETLILHFADITALRKANWVFIINPVVTGTVACSVQLFFAWRVQALTEKVWITACIIACAVISILSAIGTAIAAHYVPQFDKFQKFEVVVIFWLVPAVLADITITSSLVWHLNKRRTGSSVTDDVVNQIIRMTVQNGLLTSLVATVDLIVYLSDPAGTHFLFNLPLPQLYATSLMSTLNSRVDARRAINSESGSTNPRATDAFQLSTVVQLGATSGQDVSVNVQFVDNIFGDQNRKPKGLTSVV